MLGLVLVGAGASGLLDIFPPFVRVFFVLAVFSYLPGEVFLQRFARRRWTQVEMRVPLAVLLGLSAYSVVSWLAWLADATLDTYLAVLQVAAAAFFIVFAVEDLLRGGRRRAHDAGTGCSRRVKTASLSVVALGVAVFFLVAPPTLSDQGDAYVHIGYIRSILVENSLAPGGVLSQVDDDGPVAADPRRGTFHLLLAGCCELAGVEPVVLWRMLPVLLAPVAVLAFAGFAAALVPSGPYLLFALVLFLMFQGGLGRGFFGAIAYGQHFALVFYWVLFAVCVLSRHRRSLLDLGIVLGILFGGALIHIDVAIHFGLLFASLLLFNRVFKFPWASLTALGLGSSVCVAVVLIWKISTAYAGVNPMHSHPQGLLYFFDIGARYFVLSPAEIIRRNGLIFFTGLVLVVPLVFLRRHRRFARRNLALAVPPILIALNPWLAPLVYSRASYLLHRFLLNVPAVTITALVLGVVIAWGRRGNLLRKAAAAVVLFLWAKIFLIAATAWLNDMKSVSFDRGAPVLSGPVAGAVAFINERVPSGAVVLSDPVTSLTLTAFTHVKVVAVLSQHGNPNDRHPFARLGAVQTALSPYTTQIETLMAVRRFNVDYVLINGSFSRPIHEYLADWDPTFTPDLQNKFGTLRSVYREVYDKSGVKIFKVVGADIDRITWDPVVPFTTDVPRDLDQCEHWPTDSPVVLAGIKLDPPVALPGQEVEVTVAYRRAGDRVPEFPLVLNLRFEDRRYFETAKTYPGDKYVRRYRERHEGAFRRFRISHRLFDGYYPVQDWPWTGECYERFTVRLPTDLAETVYDVQCLITEEALVPNFTLADFVCNRDSYVGTPCTTLRIKKVIRR